MFDLNSKVALVTGASRGLGWAMARSLAQAGATVIINGATRDTRARLAELKQPVSRGKSLRSM